MQGTERDKKIEVAAEAAAWLDEASPPEIDEQLATIWGEANAIRTRMDSAKRDLAFAVGVKPVYRSRTRREVLTSVEELLEMAQAKIDNPETKPWDRESAERAVARWHELKAEHAVKREQARPLEAVYNEKKWSRFFLVRNTGGHIHSSMNCSTCHPTTSFAWLPLLSGLTEKDAVEAHGPLLCSVCYPSAPVEWTVGLEKDTKDECPGSRSYDYDRGTLRRTGYSGNGRAKCTHCGEYAGTTSTGKLRAHKKAEAA